MFIKSIVLDGFKSYAQRTEVSEFDPLFNAITGLNGSGKSNILDSICFLLGISNLSQVRATNLQELIYKNGQAGITKATVTITFDNTNKKQSPIGYDGFEEITISRQIILGGRNKYLINGCNATSSRVQDLFRSVQLNINNPHFLIMQGRITKVLNMKPLEILSMIEEAAGTRMYESKKQSAFKTMEKKQSKLQEINTVLDEDITPTIAKLKEEKANYVAYQKVAREIEHYKKLCIAYEFVRAEEMKKRSSAEQEVVQEAIKKLQRAQAENEEAIKLIDAELKELQKKKDEESGGALKQLELKVDQLSKEDVKVNSDLKHKKEAREKEEKKRKELLKNIKDDEKQVEVKEKACQELRDNVKALEEKSKQDSEAVRAAQEHFRAVSAGLMSNDEGEEKSLADQMLDCKNTISKAETEVKQANMRLKHLEKELKEKGAALKSTENSYQKDMSLHEELQKQRAKLEAELKKLNFNPGKEAELIAERKSLESELIKLQGVIETLEAKFPHLQFSYDSAGTGLNQAKVKGLVCQLIKVKDITTAVSLEVTAGNKLYNVVVDTEKTGQKLLQKGQLKRRVTIIPLSKITSKSIEDSVIRKAESLVGKTNVSTALSLVGYDQEVEAAMKFVFGSSFVCKALEDAKKVTFDPEVKTKSVTLEGDVFDPAGTLSGGARSSRISILEKLDELKEAQKSLALKEKRLAEIIGLLDSIKKDMESHSQIKNKLDMKNREAELAMERIRQSTHHQKVEEVKELEASIDQQKSNTKLSEEAKRIALKRVEDLESKMKEAKSFRERELKIAEENIKKAKSQAANSEKDFKNKGQELEEVKLEIEELKKEIQALSEQVTSSDTATLEMDQEINLCEARVSSSKEKLQEAEMDLEKGKEVLRFCTEQINSKLKERQGLLKEVNELQLELKELDHKVAKHNRECNESSQKVEQMVIQYDWIANEREYFGKPNTAFDFEANDPKEASKKLSKLQEAKDKLGKNINMRAMNMLGEAEEKYSDLMKKKEMVENDKAKIEEVISELDEKKNEALKKAWEQVNRDFGSIFSTLLPGTSAKLMPPDGQSVLDGLEVRVAFGNVWKESLSELSGGQRSLVALSLILALLLFKPAPLYILDEVDAALDLSHTQNIGQMLKSHFKHSQFIIVSLKDGMFNNANVLFKTKFIDGVSTVARYVQNQSQRDGNPKTPYRRAQPTSKRAKNV